MNGTEISENSSKNTHNKVEELLLRSKKPGKVLDIPCGAGAFSSRMIKRGITVVSSDIQNTIQFDRKNFFKADMNKGLPLVDGSFDAIVCIDGIEHIENPFLFIRECGRVLSIDGVLIISTPNISSMRSRWRWFMTGHHNKCKIPLDESKRSPSHHINMISFQKLRYILHTNGFEIVEVITNRIKSVSLLFAFFYPLSYIQTKLVYYKEEKDPLLSLINKKILKNLFSVPVYFGETLIVKAVVSRES